MAFNAYKVQTKTAGNETGAKATMSKRGAGTTRLAFTLTSATLGDLGWAAGDKLEVLIGDGEHHGLIRLRKNNSAGSATVEKRQAARADRPYFKVALGHIPAFVNRAESARHINFEAIEEGWVEFVLPKWADETAPKAAGPAPAPAKPSAAPVPRGVPVTGTLMGDPPPGRSARDAR